MDLQKTVREIGEILNNNQMLVDEAYHNKEDQILIDKKLVDTILEYLKQEGIKKKEFGEILKYAVRKFYELEPKDIVIIKQGYLFIKLVSELEQQVPQGRESTSQARYNGFEEHELVAFYEEFFTQDESDLLVLDVAKEFVLVDIIQKKMGNDEYERTVFATVKNIFYQFLLQFYQNDDEFILGFAGYMFRINFEKLFLHVAEILLQNLAKGDLVVAHFLEYYSQNVIIVHGEKYRVPAIKTSDGYSWKMVSILSVVRVYFNIKNSLVELEKKVKVQEKKAKEYYGADGKSPVQRQQAIKEALLRLGHTISDKRSTLRGYYDVLLHIHDEKERTKLQDTILIQEAEIEKLQEEREKLLSLEIAQNVMMQYQKIQKELDTLKREQMVKQKVLEQNERGYQELKRAFVKALLSRKKRL